MKRTITSPTTTLCLCGLWVLAFINLPAAFGQINYLGQAPPQNQAVLFAKGVVSTDAYEHSAPAFSPDGTRAIWTIMRSNYTGYMVEMIFANGQWSKPTPPSFVSTNSDDYYPAFSADGQMLHFASRRKLPSETAKNERLRLWKVARKGEDWDIPIPMGETLLLFKENFGHSVAKSGNIYIDRLYATTGYRWFGLQPSYNATGASGESSEGRISFKTPAFQQIKQMDAFAESILKDTVPLASGEEGMMDLKIIEAIVRSADTGNKVKLIW